MNRGKIILVITIIFLMSISCKDNVLDDNGFITDL